MNLNNADWDRALSDAISQPGAMQASCVGTDVFEWRHWATPEWRGEQALRVLGVPLLPFPDGYPAHGFANFKGIALNPRTRNKVSTMAHELGHYLLRHVELDASQTERTPIIEVEAESVALLVTTALGLTAETLESRVYIQEFIRRPSAGPLPRTWEHVKTAARSILLAGRQVVVPPPVKQRVDSVATFARRINWHS